MTKYIRSIFAAGRLSSPDTPVSSINKSDHHDLTEMFLKLALKSIAT
jgi:hypothetical protein